MMEKVKVVFKGTHPDSLYRVAPSSSSCGARERSLRAARALRWPLALAALCIGLAVSIYFLMPDVPIHPMSNSTIWGANFAIPVPRHQAPAPAPTAASTSADNAHTDDTEQDDTLPALNDTDLDAVQREIRKLVVETNAASSERASKPSPSLVAPFFPEHIAPRVQYGNERYEPAPHRERTLETHPANVYGLFYKDGQQPDIQSEPKQNEPHKENNQETNLYRQSSDYYKRNKYQPEEENAEMLEEKQPTIYHKHLTNFSSGHQNLFGISIEDANKMNPTTANPLYNTRVSPTLPTLRALGVTTVRSKNGSEDGAQCASTRLRLCRGVLPYDLAAAPLLPGSLDDALPFLEYVASSECSARARLFICSLLEPECLPASQLARPPCRSTCRAVVESCGSVLSAGGAGAASGAFECARYPAAASGACVAPRGLCLPDELRCGDGACLPAHWRCDGREDCADGEDERDCPFCAHHEIRCTSDGSCVPRAWACDGYADCADGSDEAACAPIASAASEHAHLTLPPPKNVAGESENSKEELLITSDSSSMKTFPYGRARAGAPPHASTSRKSTPETSTPAPSTPPQGASLPVDELERRVLAASAHASPCPPGELRCVDGRCIMFSQLCDGYSDCSDNADENNCYF